MSNNFIGALLSPHVKPHTGIQGAGAHIAMNEKDDEHKVKDNPANPTSIAARLASGNVQC